jgi:4-hydroxyphenylpyruvate dioxygenase
MRKSLATVSISGTLEEKLAAIARAGFDGVEIFENDLINCPLSPREVRRRADDLGLAIELYQPFRDFEAVPADQLARNLRRAERKFDVMEQLGAPMMLVCSNVSEQAIDDNALAAEQLHTLAEHAHRRGISIAYEALAWGRHVNDYRHSYEIVAAADHPHLGICLDSFHILSRGADPAGIRDIPGEKIFFLQLADAPVMAMDVLQWSRHYRCFPGQGGFDLTAFTEHVLAAGYRGPLSLEIFNDVFRQADGVRTADDAVRSLLFLEESVRDSLDEAVEGGDKEALRVRERVALFDPPAPAPLSGYAFAELAVDDAAAHRLTGVLGALGFTRTGAHRTKAAELWRHGGARVVVNREPDARPDQYHADGPVLAAFGLYADDTARAAARAEAFRARPQPRRRGPDEADLPLVAGDGRTAVLFCAGPDWEADFGAGPEAPPAGPGLLTGIDHVALPVPFDRFDEEALFLRAVLGLAPADSLELADPYGLVRSRAFTDPGGAVRIALNMPPGGSSLGVQHIAFACDDIFAAARAVRDAAGRTLPIPGNYYDDLLARWDLDEDLVASMRELGVLYDRDGDSDGDGEFLHFYTETIGRRVFFEVVQRIRGYRGFGATNAPARMAAQRAPSS